MQTKTKIRSLLIGAVWTSFAALLSGCSSSNMTSYAKEKTYILGSAENIFDRIHLMEADFYGSAGSFMASEDILAAHPESDFRKLIRAKNQFNTESSAADVANAIATLEALSSSHPEAAHALHKLYRAGLSGFVEVDLAESWKWGKISARSNFIPYMLDAARTGMRYASVVDMDSALVSEIQRDVLEISRSAASMGDQDGMMLASAIYLDPVSELYDESLGYAWLLEASRLGNSNAMRQVAEFHISKNTLTDKNADFAYMAVSIDPSAENLSTMGWAMFLLGQEVAGSFVLGTAYAVSPEDPDILRRYATSLSKMGSELAGAAWRWLAELLEDLNAPQSEIDTARENARKYGSQSSPSNGETI